MASLFGLEPSAAGPALPAGTLLSYYARSAAEVRDGIGPADYSFPGGDLRRFGAKGDDLADDAAAVNAAFAVALSDGGNIWVPVGSNRFFSTLVMDGYVTLEGESAEKSVLKKMGNFAGIELRGNGNAILSRFTLLGAGTRDTSAGIHVVVGRRCRITNVDVTAQGGDGIDLGDSNMATLRDIRTTLNGGDGVVSRGTPGAPDTNAMTTENIDTRGNRGGGLNVDSGRKNFVISVVAHSNAGGGVRINDRSNLLVIHAESNKGSQIEMTASPNSTENTLFVQEGIVSNYATADSKTGLQNRRRSVYDSSFSKVTTDRLVIPNEQTNGRAVTGTLALSHVRDRAYDLTAGGSSSDQTLRLKNDEAGARFDASADNLIVCHGAPEGASGEVVFGTTVARSAGDGGLAEPLPVTPSGYLEVSVDGKIVKMPFFNC